jgi:hypothetical protein
MTESKDPRTPRVAITREAGTRPKAWQPPSLLPDPEPRPGWVYRWIRTSIYGNADPSNISRQFREGWEPVALSEHPEFKDSRDQNSRWNDGIEIGGLLLCRIPKETMDQRAAHYANLAKSQLAAVDNNYMRENDPRMPVLSPERRTQVSFGGGSKPSKVED